MMYSTNRDSAAEETTSDIIATAPSPTSNRRKVPKSTWLLGALFAVVGLRTIRIDKLPSFELLMEESVAFSNYYLINYYMMDFGATGRGDEQEDEALYKVEDPISSRLSLDELMSITHAASSKESRTCKDGTHSVGFPKKLEYTQEQSTKQTKHTKQTRIPKVIHQMDTSHCLSPSFFAVTQKWRNLPDFEYYFHTNASLHALIDQDWPEFPHLRAIVTCISHQQGYVDLWKALVLWEFGGGVVEFDWIPRDMMQSLIPDNDTTTQAIVFSKKSWPVSQGAFMEPKHPMAFYIVMHILHNINVARSLHEIDYYATGEGPFTDGWYYFMGVDNGIKTKAGVYIMPKDGFAPNVEYNGRYNRTARLLEYGTYLTESKMEKKWRAAHYPAVTDIKRWNRTCMSITYDHLIPAAPPTTIATIWGEDTPHVQQMETASVKVQSKEQHQKPATESKGNATAV